MLDLGNFQACHFPVGADDGRYLGYHPAGNTAVIAQLEAQRALGADHLLLPEPALWWLDYYQGLRRHLEDRYVPLLRDERCAIYSLHLDPRKAAEGAIATLKRVVATLRTRSAREPSILDWRTGLEIADQLPELPVFVPPPGGGRVPYLDRSVDIVVVVSNDDHELAEARRVATSAVIAVDPEFPAVADLSWVSEAAAGWGEDVNISLLPSLVESGWEATVRGFAETLEPGFAGALTVIGAPDMLERAEEAAGGAGVPARLIEAEPAAELADRVRATESGHHRVQVLVTAPSVPLPGWLPAILALFSRAEEIGAVGGRIISRFGVLEDAGGVVTADGARRRREREIWIPTGRSTAT